MTAAHGQRQHLSFHSRRFLTDTPCIYHILLSALALLAMLTLSSCNDAPGDAPLVLAPASMENALEQLADAYVADGHERPRLSFAGTSVIARQVESGAPADLFISADADWMVRLGEKGLIDRKSVRDIASGTLVLIAPGAKGKQLTVFDDIIFTELLGDDGRFAVADIGSVPAGRYANQVLAKLSAGPELRSRAIQSDNVRGALRLVETGEAKAGFVYETDARISKKVHIVYRFPNGMHQPIRYLAGQIAESDNDAALDFLDWLGSADAETIFAEHGFAAPAS